VITNYLSLLIYHQVTKKEGIGRQLEKYNQTTVFVFLEDEI
jgi:hypothetical protein